MCWNSMYYISSSEDKQWLYRQGDKVSIYISMIYQYQKKFKF